MKRKVKRTTKDAEFGDVHWLHAPLPGESTGRTVCAPTKPYADLTIYTRNKRRVSCRHCLAYLRKMKKIVHGIIFQNGYRTVACGKYTAGPESASLKHSRVTCPSCLKNLQKELTLHAIVLRKKAFSPACGFPRRKLRFGQLTYLPDKVTCVKCLAYVKAEAQPTVRTMDRPGESTPGGTFAYAKNRKAITAAILDTKEDVFKQVFLIGYSAGKKNLEMDKKQPGS